MITVLLSNNIKTQRKFGSNNNVENFRNRIFQLLFSNHAKIQRKCAKKQYYAKNIAISA